MVSFQKRTDRCARPLARPLPQEAAPASAVRKNAAVVVREHRYFSRW
jgi:hypothetical protein